MYPREMKRVCFGHLRMSINVCGAESSCHAGCLGVGFHLCRVLGPWVLTVFGGEMFPGLFTPEVLSVLVHGVRAFGLRHCGGPLARPMHDSSAHDAHDSSADSRTCRAKRGSHSRSSCVTSSRSSAVWPGPRSARARRSSTRAQRWTVNFRKLVEIDEKLPNSWAY